MSSHGHSSENIVKKLFLPNYTQSGSNEAFHHGMNMNNNNNQNDNGSESTSEDHGHGGDLSVSNAPFQYAKNRNFHHVEEYDGSQIGGYAPTVSVASVSVASVASSSTSGEKKAVVKPIDIGGEEGMNRNTDEDTGTDVDADSHVDADADADADADTKSISMSTAVNTGASTSRTNYSDGEGSPMKLQNTMDNDSHSHDHNYNNHYKNERLRHNMHMPQTPKNDHLLSPPSVMRKIPEMDMDHGVVDGDCDERLSSSALKPANLFRPKPGNGNGSGRGDITSNAHARIGNYHPFQTNDEGNQRANSNMDDDDEEETGSMVSQYGSDVGEVKLRLEDVRGMEAVAEEQECSDGNDEEDGANDNKDNNDNTKGNAGDIGGDNYEANSNFMDFDQMNGKGQSLYMVQNGSGQSFDQRQTLTQTRSGQQGSYELNKSGDDVLDYDQDDDLSHGYDASVTSIDLASQHESASGVGGMSTSASMSTGIQEQDMYEYTHFNEHMHISSPKRSTCRGPIPALPDFAPKSNAKKETVIPPSSPMGAVSAALRRFGNGFGNGMSNMTTRCTQPIPTIDKSYVGPTGGEIWLSPRFGKDPHMTNAAKRSSVSTTSSSSSAFIQQPIIGDFSRRSKRRSRKTGTERAAAASQMLGISNCLSFDPESGRKPYMNMRVTDSPPAMPGHRKTRSWGSVHSGDFFIAANGKQVFDNVNGMGSSSNAQRIEMPPHPHSPGKMGSPVQSQFKASRTPSSTNAFNSDGVVGRMMDGILSPRGKEKLGEILMSPRRKNSVSDVHESGSYTSPSRSTVRTFTPNKKNRSILVLRSPQRVDNVEHEDALDLLALLVERSVSFNGTLESAKSDGDQESHVSIEECISVLRTISEHYDDDGGKTSHESRMSVLDNLESAHTYAMEMKQASLSASTWLHAIGRLGKTSSSKSSRESFSRNDSRVVLSNEEMSKMDSKELISIVQSIELQLADKEELNNRLDNELSKCRAEIGRLKTTSRTENSFVAPDKSILDEEAGDDSTATTSVGGNEFPDNSDIDIDVTDTIATKVEEGPNNATCLADAKKEILLLKAELEEANKMLKNMEGAIKWPNSNKNAVKEEGDQINNNGEKDDSGDEDDKSKSREEEQEPEGKEIAFTSADDDGSSSDAPKSCKDENTSTFERSFLKNALQEELEEYVTVVQEADRDKIRSLEQKIELLEKNKCRESDPDKKMIHVRMLDAENFVTDWDSLGPLPPPPDHDLRSPIVHDLLTQWTNDSKTQESLLQWVEGIMSGDEPSNVPPLQLSGLDHRVRDGFTMHILPFLLRRSDIHVEVTTRAHRRTSYDVSVTVRSSQLPADGSISFGSQQNSDGSNHVNMNLAANKPHMMAFKASTAGGSLEDSIETSPFLPERRMFNKDYYTQKGSPTHSAVTTPICNHTISSSQLSRLTKTASDDGLALSEDMKRRQSQHQSGGIVAGAWKSMGDLLSRRKTPSNDDDSSTSHKERSTYVPPQSPLLEDITELSETEEDNQPYHRVVSAPPGKIGITFVQYRGHAMVSDVYNDSPLSGWVFPSDILIAVDEVPVSGMRVPEIVDLLTVRKERQRALRVISSHAMTELLITEDSGALMDG